MLYTLTSHNIKPTDSRDDQHFCWETLDPDMHVDASWHKPVAQTPLHTPHGKQHTTQMTLVPQQENMCCHTAKTASDTEGVLITSVNSMCFFLLRKDSEWRVRDSILLANTINTECVLCVTEAVFHLGAPTGNKTGLCSQGCYWDSNNKQRVPKIPPGTSALRCSSTNTEYNQIRQEFRHRKDTESLVNFQNKTTWAYLLCMWWCGSQPASPLVFMHS